MRAYLAVLEGEDEAVAKRLESDKRVSDFMLGDSDPRFVLAVAEEDSDLGGVDLPCADGDYVALVAESDTDYSGPTYTVYGDPRNTETLLDELEDGFIVKTGARRYMLPADMYAFLKAVRGGERVELVFRKDGLPCAVMDSRLFLARLAPKHPRLEEVLGAFKLRGSKAVKAHVIAFTVKDGKITVDNTLKPKTVRVESSI